MVDGVAHIVCDHQRGQPVFGHDAVGQLQHLGGGGGVECGGVLVEQEKLRLLQRRHQQRQRLALAAGQKADLGRHAVFKPKAQRRKLFAVQLALRLCHAPAERPPLAAAQGQRQIFLQLHVRGRAHHGVLEHAADEGGALVLRQIGDVRPAEHDRTAVHGPHAGHGVEQRGFSGAVSADDGDEIAVAQMQIEIDQRLFLVDGAGVEGFADVVDIKHFPAPPFCRAFCGRTRI